MRKQFPVACGVCLSQLVLLLVFSLFVRARLPAAEWGNDDWVALAASTVNVNGGGPNRVEKPGANAGAVDLRTGVNIDVGDGSDGDLTSSITLEGGAGDNWAKFQYRQVAPEQFLSTAPFTITIRGNVEIHCQYLFAPRKVIAE